MFGYLPYGMIELKNLQEEEQLEKGFITMTVPAMNFCLTRGNLYVPSTIYYICRGLRSLKKAYHVEVNVLYEFIQSYGTLDAFKKQLKSIAT